MAANLPEDQTAFANGNEATSAFAWSVAALVDQLGGRRLHPGAEHARAQANFLLRDGQRQMRVGEQLADFAGGGERMGDFRHRRLADNRRHVGVAARGGQRGSELRDADHRLVDGVFGLMQVGCDFLGRRNSFIQHVLFP